MGQGYYESIQLETVFKHPVKFAVLLSVDVTLLVTPIPAFPSQGLMYKGRPLGGSPMKTRDKNKLPRHDKGIISNNHDLMHTKRIQLRPGSDPGTRVIKGSQPPPPTSAPTPTREPPRRSNPHTGLGQTDEYNNRNRSGVFILVFLFHHRARSWDSDWCRRRLADTYSVCRPRCVGRSGIGSPRVRFYLSSGLGNLRPKPLAAIQYPSITTSVGMIRLLGDWGMLGQVRQGSGWGGI